MPRTPPIRSLIIVLHITVLALVPEEAGARASRLH